MGYAADAARCLRAVVAASAEDAATAAVARLDASGLGRSGDSV